MAVQLSSPETARAQAVLDDCRSALNMLREAPNGAGWRITWCAALALLRAVGHVLRSEARSPSASQDLRQAVEAWWEQIKKDKQGHKIFWDFIEKDRNALLKEYRFNAQQSVPIRGAFRAPLGSASFGGTLALPTYLMKDGSYAGRDQREVVNEAIEWWQKQLNEINTRIKQP